MIHLIGTFTKIRMLGRKKKSTVYKDCSCVAKASVDRNTSLSKHWIEKDVLTEFDHPPPESIIEETYR